MSNPVSIVPGATKAQQALDRSTRRGGMPAAALDLVHLRASQINGCTVCVDRHGNVLRSRGETKERVVAVAGWRDASCFTDAERAALALAEAVTRLSDRKAPVPQAIREDAARYYDERALAMLIVAARHRHRWSGYGESSRYGHQADDRRVA